MVRIIRVLFVSLVDNDRSRGYFLKILAFKTTVMVMDGDFILFGALWRIVFKLPCRKAWDIHKACMRRLAATTVRLHLGAEPRVRVDIEEALFYMRLFEGVLHERACFRHWIMEVGHQTHLAGDCLRIVSLRLDRYWVDLLQGGKGRLYFLAWYRRWMVYSVTFVAFLWIEIASTVRVLSCSLLTLFGECRYILRDHWIYSNALVVRRNRYTTPGAWVAGSGRALRRWADLSSVWLSGVFETTKRTLRAHSSLSVPKISVFVLLQSV